MAKFFVIAVFVLTSIVPAWAGVQEVSNIVTPYTNGSGEHYLINGTGINLFEPVTPYDPPTATGIWSDNNTAPIAYPGENPAYAPSPGSYDNYALAQEFDIKGILYRYDGLTGAITVWLVTGMGPDGTQVFGNNYSFGDVFIDTNSKTQANYNYAFMSFGENPGLAANHTVWNAGYGQVWSDSNNREAGLLAPIAGGSVLFGINGPNSFASYPSVMSAAGPWALNNPTAGSGAPLRYQEITGPAVSALNYAGAPSGFSGAGDAPIYIYEYNGVLPTGLNGKDFGLHAGFQCGNDFTNHATQVVPAPGALILGLVGVALVTVRRRRRVA